MLQLILIIADAYLLKLNGNPKKLLMVVCGLGQSSESVSGQRDISQLGWNKKSCLLVSNCMLRRH
jgi:hypothetical protein